ncbi:MAG: hypothetical protein LBH13_06240 [Cellulomonadaceae bacterium]|jgi:uncharacterized protein YjdB|nr:hypothetical protein [Cellulomonadaceae bacterium]
MKQMRAALTAFMSVVLLASTLAGTAHSSDLVARSGGLGTDGLSADSLSTANLAASNLTTSNLSTVVPSGKLFTAGNIISDAVFTDSGSMSASAIQKFLKAQGKDCVAGSAPCIKDYTVSKAFSVAAVPGKCKAVSVSKGDSAATLIKKVATACKINPRVLLVMLQKEQGLITMTKPTASRYDRAFGLSCPDNANGWCDPQYAGFFNQLYGAGDRFWSYRNNLNSANPTYGYRPGRSQKILYSPNQSCGSSNVYIENMSTALLYIYTPYQPNAAALASMSGVGNSCSAYGNRNFFRFFFDWFGDPRVASSLAKAPNHSQVYLLDRGTKRPISAAWTRELTRTLGAVGVISATGIAAYPTAGTLQRIVRNPDNGQVWSLYGGKKYLFTSDALITSWSGKAAASSAIDLDPLVLHRLPQGANIPRTDTSSTPQLLGLGAEAGKGTKNWVTGTGTIGTSGKLLEAMVLNVVNSPGSGIECSAKMEAKKWRGWVKAKSVCGVMGQGKRIEGVKLRLTGPLKNTHDVWYRVRTGGLGWHGWTRNGAFAGTTGWGRRIEQVQVRLQAKGAGAPGVTRAPGVKAMQVRALVTTKSWTGWKNPLVPAQTTSKKRHVRAVAVRFPGVQPWKGSVQCSARITGQGWKKYVGAKKTCGTKKANQQMEAVRLRFTGDMKKHMDIWYRVKTRPGGWSGWAKNGQSAGTSLGAEITAIEVSYQKHGSKKPGSQAHRYRTR